MKSVEISDLSRELLPEKDVLIL